MNANVSRRSLLKGGGALIVAFSLNRPGWAQEGEVQGAGGEPEKPKLPGSLAENPLLDSWIRIGAEGDITVLTGKAELGQGVKTALIQIAAEELRTVPERIALVTADTGRTADEGYTAGSQSMQNSGTAIRHAAAQARALLLAEAAKRWAADPLALTVEAESVAAPDGRKLAYRELVSGALLHVEARPDSPLTDPETFRVMGRSVPRVDIPAKVTGAPAYVQDIRLPGMLHARVVRPPSYGATLEAVDTRAVEAVPGVVRVLRDGDFLAVVAEKEWTAVKAMRLLARAARWREPAGQLPDAAGLPAFLRSLPAEDGTVADEGRAAGVTRTFEATFTRPYQIHGSIGPSCAVAHYEGDALQVWSHTQGVFPDREAIAAMLGMPLEKVRVVHAEGSGCYGHNGADDAAGDAALIARAMPGRPVRVQAMREQEHGWEPFGPAMVTSLRAGLDAAGRIVDWNYELWSNTHSTRPGPAGALLAGRHSAARHSPEAPKLQISPSGNGDRNAVPLYAIPSKHVVWHFLKDMPLRVSALRGLGAYANVFAIESAVDELALMAGADPVEFRLRHLEDERARAVVVLAAQKFGWHAGETLPRGHGRGFAFARYKNLAAYLALAMDLEVDEVSGRITVGRVVCAIDAGEIVSPDGIRNQTEGGIIQSLSWTMFEAVTFDRTRITSIDWASYPIMRFGSLPRSVEVHLVERPGLPFLGAGEAAQGPAAAALANAVRSAIARRITDLPLTRERIKAALSA